MSNPVLAIFVDTNCFIHLRDVQDLPWRVLFPDFSAFEIVVAPIVIEELDGLKARNQRRQRTRANLALETILKASAQPDLRTKLRDEPITLSLRISNSPRIDWSNYPDLDPLRPDDRLVAAMLADPAAGPKVLVSHDRAPLIRARFMGQRAEAPHATWFLPEQQDLDARGIGRARHDLDRLASGTPEMEIEFTRSGELLETLSILVPRLKPLSDRTCRELAMQFAARNPREKFYWLKRKGVRYERLRRGYSWTELVRYSRSHARCMRNAEGYFSLLHERVGEAARTASFDCCVANAGTITAHKVIADIQASSHLHVFRRQDVTYLFRGPISGPLLPSLPMTEFDRLIETQEARRKEEQASAARNGPMGICWQSFSTTDFSRISATCLELRPEHSMDMSLGLYYRDSGYRVETGNVNITVSSSNSPAPISRSVEISVQKREASWREDWVLDYLDGWLADALRRSAD